MSAQSETPRTDAWQDEDWELCGNDPSRDYNRAMLAYTHCRELERQLSAPGASSKLADDLEAMCNKVNQFVCITKTEALEILAALRAPQAAPSAPAAPSAQLNMLVDREGMKTLIKDTPDMDFEVGASAQCPMCGDNWPHEHSAKEVVIFKNGMKRERKRQEVLRYGPAKFEVTGQMRAYLEAAIPKSNHLSEAMIDAGVAEATNKEGEWSDYVTRIYLAMRGKEVSAPSAKGWAIKGPDGVIDLDTICDEERHAKECVSDFRSTRWNDLLRYGYTCVPVTITERSGG